MKGLLKMTAALQRVILFVCFSALYINGFGQYNLNSASIPDAAYQTIIPASIPSVLNSAIYTGGSGTVKGVAFDDNSGGAIRFTIDDGFSKTGATVTSLGVGYTYSNPDIVIGGGINYYFVGVTYTAEISGVKSVYLEVFQLTHIGHTIMPYMTINSCGGVMISDGTNNADSSHIDLVSTYSAGGPVADVFAMSWQDASCNYSIGGAGVKGCYGTLSAQWANCDNSGINYLGCINDPASKDATSSDVAIGLRSSNNHYISVFAYVDPSNDELLSRAYDVTATSFASEQSEDNPGSGIIKQPRIDIYDRNVGASDGYEIAYNYYNGSGNSTWDVAHINPALGGTPEIVSSYYNAAGSTSDNDNYSPVVTAGSGSYYTLAYACPGIDEIYSHTLDITNSGLVTTTGGYQDYYEVNYYPTVSGPIAASNDYVTSCVGGCHVEPNNIQVCWINNSQANANPSTTQIDCKVSASTGAPSFKPTSTSQFSTYKTVDVYPNPTTNYLIVHKPDGGTYYVTDIMGKVVLQGNLQLNSFKIDVSNLPTGNYMLIMKNIGYGVTSVKFAKN